LRWLLLTVYAALSSLEGGKKLNTSFQIRYVLNPGTTFYVGYADRQQNLRLIGNPQYLKMTDDLDLHTGRKVYMKFNYLFQL
jgi:hypothetical protein